MADNSIINLGELSKPATVLIEKVADAVGGICKPWQIVRLAKAEATADRIQAESQIAITDLQRRAFDRFLEEEVKKQANIESITTAALPLLSDEADPTRVENDWIANFFDKARIVSDDEMQFLWSKVLAGQANVPGRFSRKTVNLLADLDKSDAELFERLCRFGWRIAGLSTFAPLVYDYRAKVYTEHGITFDSLAHLESLGLIQFNALSEYMFTALPKTVTAHYNDRQVDLSFPMETDNNLAIGMVLLTQAGTQLAMVCTPCMVDGFFEYVYRHWADRSLIAMLGQS